MTLAHQMMKTFQREVQGDRVGALGRMFNPVYFNYGIAMHGAGNVPLEPASHGCIRMHKTISNTFQLDMMKQRPVLTIPHFEIGGFSSISSSSKRKGKHTH